MKATGKILSSFNLAAKLAEKSYLTFKHGAVCLKGRKVLSVGHNSDRCYYKRTYGPSFHAEISAMANLPTRYRFGLQRKL